MAVEDKEVKGIRQRFRALQDEVENLTYLTEQKADLEAKFLKEAQAGNDVRAAILKQEIDAHQALIDEQRDLTEAQAKMQEVVKRSNAQIFKFGKEGSLMAKISSGMNDKFGDLANAGGMTGDMINHFGKSLGKDGTRNLIKMGTAIGLTLPVLKNLATGLYSVTGSLPGATSGIGDALVTTGRYVFDTGLDMQALGKVMKENSYAFRTWGTSLTGAIRGNEDMRIAMNMSREDFAELSAISANNAGKEIKTTAQLQAHSRKYINNLQTLAMQTGRNAQEILQERVNRQKSTSSYIATLDANQRAMFAAAQNNLDGTVGGVRALFDNIFQSGDVVQRQQDAIKSFDSLKFAMHDMGINAEDAGINMVKLQEDMQLAARGDQAATARVAESMKKFDAEVRKQIDSGRKLQVVQIATTKGSADIISSYANEKLVRNKAGVETQKQNQRDVAGFKARQDAFDGAGGEFLKWLSTVTQAIGNFGGGLSSLLLAIIAMKGSWGMLGKGLLFLGKGLLSAGWGLIKFGAGLVGTLVKTVIPSLISFSAKLMTMSFKGLMMGLGSLGTRAIQAGAGLLAMMGPVGWIIAGVTALVVTLVAFREEITAGVDWIANFLSANGLGGIGEYIQSFMKVVYGIIDFVKGIFTLDGDLITSAGNAILEGFGGMISGIFNALIEIPQKILGWVLDGWKLIIDGIFGEGAFGAIATFFDKWLIQPFKKVFGWIPGMLSSIKDWVMSLMPSALNENVKKHKKTGVIIDDLGANKIDFKVLEKNKANITNAELQSIINSGNLESDQAEKLQKWINDRNARGEDGAPAKPVVPVAKGATVKAQTTKKVTAPTAKTPGVPVERTPQTVKPALKSREEREAEKVNMTNAQLLAKIATLMEEVTHNTAGTFRISDDINKKVKA